MSTKYAEYAQHRKRSLSPDNSKKDAKRHREVRAIIMCINLSRYQDIKMFLTQLISLGCRTEENHLAFSLVQSDNCGIDWVPFFYLVYRPSQKGIWLKPEQAHQLTTRVLESTRIKTPSTKRS